MPIGPTTKKWVTKQRKGSVMVRHVAIVFLAVIAASLTGLLGGGIQAFAGVLLGSFICLFTLAYWSYLLHRVLKVEKINAAIFPLHFLLKLLITGAAVYLGIVILNVSAIGFVLGFLTVLTVFSFILARVGRPAKKTSLNRFEWLRDS